MIPELPKTWIYIYHVGQGKFITKKKEVSYTKESITVMLEGIYIDNWFQT